MEPIVGTEAWTRSVNGPAVLAVLAAKAIL